MTSDGGDIGANGPLSPSRPRHFGQLPDLAVPDDFDEPLPPSEAAMWEVPESADQEAGDAALDDDDWPMDVEELRKVLQKSEADIAAGRTVSEDEIRARYGIPRSDEA